MKPGTALVAQGPTGPDALPEDIAGTVAWLASEAAGFVTGQVIGLSGRRIIV